jgi:hypothetical protein
MTNYAFLLIELTFSVVIAGVFCLSFLLSRRLVMTVLWSIVISYLSVLPLRPVEYNSDTERYWSYFLVARQTDDLVQLVLSKLEPVHLVTSLIAPTFELWLLLESFLYASLLFALSRRIKSPEGLAILIGVTLPLMSSSFRFAVGLLLCCTVFAYMRGRKHRWLPISIGGGMGHAVLIVAPLVVRRSAVALIAIVLVFFIAIQLIPELGARATLEEEEPPGVAGIRTFLAIVIVMAYHKLATQNADRAALGLEFSRLRSLLFGVCLMLLVNLQLYLLNRWLVLLLALLAIELFQRDELIRVSKAGRAIFSGLLFMFLVLPFWLPRLLLRTDL